MMRCGCVFLLVLLAACGSQESAPGNNAPGDNAPGDNAPGNNAPGNNGSNNTPASVTYHGEARAIIESRCVGCHQAGGVGPFTLTYEPEEWREGPAWWAQSAAMSVASGTMPPWQAADDCREIDDDRSMPEAEKAVIAAWAEGGFAVGDEATYVAPEENSATVALPDFDLVIGAAEAYTPNLDTPDDYRCLLLEHTFEEDTFVTGSMALPGDPETVHHVLVYQIAPNGLDDVLARDAADPGLGYSCYGGTGGIGGPVAGWVPGSVPQTYPPGSAIVIPAGTRLVMQMHYNTLNVDAATPDKTEIGFWTLPAGQTPQRRVVVEGFANGEIMIPAGDPASRHVKGFDLPVGARIIGASPHMHTLGVSIRSEIDHADGETSCVVDIPSWDFNWQQFYQFKPEAFVTIAPGDVQQLTCVYNNSAANQPVVNGEQIEPRDVRWGEGTLDEMCLNYLVLDAPYVADGELQCGAWGGCVESCGADDTGCFLGCLGRVSDGCQSCLIEETTQCAVERCPSELEAVGGCLDGCDDELLLCLTGDCQEEMDALYVCERPAILSGQCDDELSACGVGF